MTFARSAVLAAVLAAGCSSKPAEDRAPPAPDPARAAPPAAPVTAPEPARAANAPSARAGLADNLPASFPPDCVEYAALIKKLGACDRLGAARDGLTQAYLDVATAWPGVPADRHAEVAAQCKTQAESLRNAAAATCGW
jgi:hypothetical protein